MGPATGTQTQADLARLTASLHTAQAQGLLRNPEAVENLLLGIARAIARTVEGNRREPDAAGALQSTAYWDYFEMELKEALLGSFSGLDPALCEAARRVVDVTLGSLKRFHLCS